MVSNGFGTPGFTVEGAGATSSRIDRAIDLDAVERNGRTPATISYTVTPNAHTSVRPSDGSPRICSGARYSGVPMTSAGAVIGAVSPSGSGAVSTSLARPK